MKKQILIVDDESHTRSLLRDILEPEGYAILEAPDGAEAWDILERQPVDLLITDRSMPHVSGLELLKKLFQSGRRIPSVMISAYGEERMWGDALAYGAHDYILKPFKTEDIVRLVKKMLRGDKK